ncbi:hypothetical protein ACWCQ1_44830 [Streptomyces sp. NPDC002144]
MAGAVVSPATPGIRSAYAGTADVGLLARMIISAHALAIVRFAPFAGAFSERIGGKRALATGMLAFALGGTSGFYHRAHRDSSVDTPAFRRGRKRTPAEQGRESRCAARADRRSPPTTRR